MWSAICTLFDRIERVFPALKCICGSGRPSPVVTYLCACMRCLQLQGLLSLEYERHHNCRLLVYSRHRKKGPWRFWPYFSQRACRIHKSRQQREVRNLGVFCLPWSPGCLTYDARSNISERWRKKRLRNRNRQWQCKNCWHHKPG